MKHQERKMWISITFFFENSANPSLSTIIPPRAVPFPLVYFDVEWTETSTPHSIGLNKAALVTVLSQIVIIPCFLQLQQFFQFG